MNKIIEDLNWRYAVKKYDSTKVVSENDIELLKQVISLTPTSIGLQAYKVLIIENKEIRVKLRENSHQQSQITDASHLFLFCNFTNIEDEYVHKVIKNMQDIRSQTEEELSGFKHVLLQADKNKSIEEFDFWTAKQTYIALGLLIQSAAQLKIDATPMEGFSKEAYNEILDLKSKGLTASVACTLGYRCEQDKYQFLKKVRKPLEMLFEII